MLVPSGSGDFRKLLRNTTQRTHLTDSEQNTTHNERRKFFPAKQTREVPAVHYIPTLILG